MGRECIDSEWVGGMLVVVAKFQGLTRGAEERGG